VAGLVEERLGNTAKAREVLKMGLDLFPSHGALYKVLGELEMKHGAVALARELFSRGLDEDPYYAPVYHAAALLEAKTGNLEVTSYLFDTQIEIDTRITSCLLFHSLETIRVAQEGQGLLLVKHEEDVER
jgi:tetratricopeptide (TPR) repeat protein